MEFSAVPTLHPPLFCKKIEDPPHFPYHREGHKMKIFLYTVAARKNNDGFRKGGGRMLEPVTKKFEDGSTLETFRFTFFCDICGKAVKEITYPYKPPFKAKFFISKSERRARELLWLHDHDSAYERANKEVLLQFNRCPACGKRVCEDCYNELEGLCRECARKIRGEKDVG